MITIPLQSPVDLENENIIEKDFSFKRKNSLVYKGLLSNMRYKKDVGFLSTTGKNITTTSNSIVIDGITYSVAPEGYITKSGDVTIPNNVIFARMSDNGLFTIQKLSSTSVILSNGEDTFTVDSLSSVDINGTITKNNIFVVASYFSTTTRIDFFDDEFNLLDTFTVNETLGSKSVSTFVLSDAIWVGFDSEDMRKRFCYVYDNTSATHTFVQKVHGLGLISENGIVTGEPLFWSTSETFDHEHEIKNAADLSQYTKLNSDIQYLSYNDNTFSHEKFLDNGIRQSERFDTTYGHPKYKGIASGTPTDYVRSGVIDLGYSWQSAVNPLSINPNTYRTGTQLNSNYIPDGVGIMDFSPGDYSSTGTELATVIHVYVYAVTITDKNNFRVKAVPAMRRSPVSAFEYALDYGIQWASYERGTEISFMNFSNPIGRVGASLGDGDQVFPHMRFFGNNTNEKGTYWDYGKGWVRFFYDTIHYAKYNSTGFGTAIYEEPLKIITFDENGLKTEIVDVQKTENPADYLGTASDINYYFTADSSLMVPSTWYNGNTAYATAAATLGYDLPTVLNLRMHPIVTEQISSTVWMYNHSFGQDIMSARPFTVSLGRNNSFDVSKQIYNGIATSLSANKTLLFTPHSMEDAYTFNDGYFTTWSSNKLTWAKLETTGTIKLSKMTDYVFKANIIGDKNVLVEDRYGTFSLQRAFIPYIMDSTMEPYIGIDYKMPDDSSTTISNDVYYFGAGFNSTINEKDVSTSFLLPAVTVPFYLDTTLLTAFNKELISNKKGLIRADIDDFFYDNELVEEYWTHTQATTDVSYKNSKFLVSGVVQDTYDEDYVDTSWIPSANTIIYPIGILSKIYGENYITSTVDVGDNYVSRFYNKNNKTFLIFNNVDQVYYGSEIFTIQSGNYYFDGQGIYYLGSQSDYTQNIFTAYAVGMKFLANSSSEAYFYSEWDKNIYLYTASNTLQRSISLADMGNIVDSLYSPAEQALYILFDDGKLFIKTQADSCLIENVEGTQLQSTNVGSQIISEKGYEIYNPYMWNKLLPLNVETEWLGNSDTVTKYRYIDVVFYSETPKNYDATVSVDALNGTKVKHIELHVHISKVDWKNHLYRTRIVPKEISGNAIKIYCNSDDISIFSISVDAVQSSTQTSAARGARY